MARRSAGLLLVRSGPAGSEVLLVHPGGPVWAKRDGGAWSIPKGEHGPDEEAEAAARREFEEELGHPAPAGPARLLGSVTQRGGKVVTAFALPGDLDPATIRSNTVEIAWPPGSGRRLSVPEVDRAEWFTLADAAVKLIEAQRAFLDRLAALSTGDPGVSP